MYILIFVGVLWLIFAVGLPLLIINISGIALILGYKIEKFRKYIFPLSFFASIFVIFDYYRGWFSKALVSNVPFLSSVMSIFYYLNIITGMLAAFLFINNIAYKLMPHVAEDIEFSKRDMFILGSLIVVFSFFIWLVKSLNVNF